MYELVNTSLPKGLLPGTSGFATVAMTRGTPDAVRVALDGLSSYRHRVSARGDRYWTENPIVWSHLVLPQGGAHVLSCVRTADFDYSGRTNRQARHLCLAASEFPADANGADIIASLAGDLSAPWQGEARWLETRPAPAAIVRPDKRAIAFTEFYGVERGPALAASLAALLCNELQGANRPLVFRTSQTWDSDGTRLLRLFGDLIALLPPNLRSRATFCTYPAALPGYMACHLRGAQPDDPQFTSLMVGRPWFDCASGEARGAPLPTPEKKLLQLATYGHEQQEIPPGPKSISSGAVPQNRELPKVVRRPSGQSTISFQNIPPAAGGRNAIPPRSGNDWLPPKKKDNTILYAIIGGLAITVAILASFVLMKTTSKPHKPQNPSSATPASVTTTTTPSTNITNTTTTTTNTATITTLPSETTNAVIVAPAPSAPSHEPKSVPKSKPKWEFEAATKLSSEKQKPDEFVSGFFFFYDLEGTFKKEKAEPKDPPLGTGGSKTWGTLPDFTTCLILYDKDAKTAWFHWPQEHARLFDSNDLVNLQELCFGKEKAVYDTWEKLHQGKHLEYEIQWKNSTNMSGSFMWGSPVLSRDQAMSIIAEKVLTELENALMSASNNWERAKSNHDEAKMKAQNAESYSQKAKEFAASETNLNNQLKKKTKETPNAKTDAGKKQLDNEKAKIHADISKNKEECKKWVETLPEDVRNRCTPAEPKTVYDKLQEYSTDCSNARRTAEGEEEQKKTDFDKAVKEKNDYDSLGKEAIGSFQFIVTKAP